MSRGTELVRAIRSYVSPERGKGVIFLPWYSPSEQSSRDELPELAKLLALPLIILPTHYSVTHDARLLEDLVARLCPPEPDEELPKELRELGEALEHLPYSAFLEDCALERIRSHLHSRLEAKQRRLALATLGSGAAADSAVSRMLAWTHRLGLHTVLVLAHKKPIGRVTTIDLPLASLYRDIHDFSPSARVSTAAREPSATADKHPTPPRFAVPQSFYQELLGFIEKWAPRSRRAARKSAPLETRNEWAELLARLSAPNWPVAKAILESWSRLDKALQGQYESLRSRAVNPEMPDKLIPNNKEERETQEGRLRFLMLLDTLYPTVFEAALHELDGTDQLYRVHLILCGQTATDSLLASSLLPFWQRYLDDPLFCELFYSCFNSVGRGNSLVARFESRSQLHRLLSQVVRVRPSNSSDTSSSEGKRVDGKRPRGKDPDSIDALVDAHANWLGKLATRTEPSGTDANESAVKRIHEEAVQGRDELFRKFNRIQLNRLTATDALQAAQLLLSAYELTYDVRESGENSVFPFIQDLTNVAISQSRAAIRTDAALLSARALALRGRRDDALEVLRILRRTARDLLTRAAVQLEEAFVQECEGDYLTAVRLYQVVLAVGESMGADELVARAAGGCLRCDVASGAKDKKTVLPMRARIVIQIQSARAPELFPMSGRSKPTVFLSYRRYTRLVTRGLQNALTAGKKLESWSDVKLQPYEDFSPVIHRRLHESDAIILLLSESYFDSPWCVHELHFALGQHELRGVPLYWAWCVEVSSPAQKRAAAKKAKPRCRKIDLKKSCDRLAVEAIEATFDNTNTSRQGYELAHVRDRLRRLFAYGQLLSSNPVFCLRTETNLNDAATDWNPGVDPPVTRVQKRLTTAIKTLMIPLERPEAHLYLYRRAKLHYADTYNNSQQLQPQEASVTLGGGVSSPGISPAIPGPVDLSDRNPASVMTGLNEVPPSDDGQASALEDAVHRAQVNAITADIRPPDTGTQ